MSYLMPILVMKRKICLWNSNSLKAGYTLSWLSNNSEIEVSNIYNVTLVLQKLQWPNKKTVL